MSCPSVNLFILLGAIFCGLGTLITPIEKDNEEDMYCKVNNIFMVLGTFTDWPQYHDLILMKLMASRLDVEY